MAYNGIQSNTKTQSAKATAATFQKKYESYNSATGAYPATAANGDALEATLNGNTQSSIGSIQVGTPSSTNGNTTVSVAYCSAGATGVRIGWWDYAANALVADNSRIIVLQNGSSCTAWSTTPLV